MYVNSNYCGLLYFAPAVLEWNTSTTDLTTLLPRCETCRLKKSDILSLAVSCYCGLRYVVLSTYRSFATTVSQLKICDFSGDYFKGFEVL